MIRYRFENRTAAASRVVLMTLLFVLLPLASCAITKQDADAAYRRGNFQQAIADYKYLLRQGRSADLYYNLGNAYYRSDSIAMAVLAYERACLLSPGDRDIRFNLQFVRSKTIDKLVPETPGIFATGYYSLVNLANADTWAYVSIVSIVLTFVLLLVYLFAPHVGLRKGGFFSGLAFLLVFGFSTLFAWNQKKVLDTYCGAVIMAPSVNVKKTPAQNGEDAFILHEGTRVDVTDRSLKAWRGITLPDGREGWIPAAQLEMI